MASSILRSGASTSTASTSTAAVTGAIDLPEALLSITFSFLDLDAHLTFAAVCARLARLSKLPSSSPASLRLHVACAQRLPAGRFAPATVRFLTESTSSPDGACCELGELRRRRRRTGDDTEVCCDHENDDERDTQEEMEEWGGSRYRFSDDQWAACVPATEDALRRMPSVRHLVLGSFAPLAQAGARILPWMTALHTLEIRGWRDVSCDFSALSSLACLDVGDSTMKWGTLRSLPASLRSLRCWLPWRLEVDPDSAADPCPNLRLLESLALTVSAFAVFRMVRTLSRLTFLSLPYHDRVRVSALARRGESSAFDHLTVTMAQSKKCHFHGSCSDRSSWFTEHASAQLLSVVHSLPRLKHLELCNGH